VPDADPTDAALRAALPSTLDLPARATIVCTFGLVLAAMTIAPLFPVSSSMATRSTNDGVRVFASAKS